MQEEHAPHELGRMLEVGVHDDDGVTLGMLEAGEHRRLLAEIATEGDIAGTGVGLGDLLEERERPVLASVVHIDQLEFLPEQGELIGHMLMEGVAADLEWVEQIVAPGGIVVLDDYGDKAWPGVQDALDKHLASGGSRLSLLGRVSTSAYLRAS